MAEAVGALSPLWPTGSVRLSEGLIDQGRVFMPLPFLFTISTYCDWPYWLFTNDFSKPSFSASLKSNDFDKWPSVPTNLNEVALSVGSNLGEYT